ncbi:MAG: TerC family protein [Myxococcota bacterium]|nr:TerC family protein [Myxococcota bacterium]
MHSIGTPGLWAGFTALVFCLLALDLGVFNRRAHTVSVREASMWTALWFSIAAAFNGFLYWRFGGEAALEFATCYLIEEALSVDNLFVFLVLFQFFEVESQNQHRVLFWGILGAMVFRALFVFAGTALVAQFHAVMYAFGAILVWTALKLVRGGNAHEAPTEGRLYKMFARIIAAILPVTPEMRGPHIFVRENGRLHATPLLLVLIAIETTDIIFAIDSVPAAFGVSQDPFIIYTSNIFAILGLRALYFVLARIMERFRYLKYGLAFVLAFVGGKMIAEYWHIKLPVTVSLAVIAASIAVSAVVSLLVTRRETPPRKNASQNATPTAPPPA